MTKEQLKDILIENKCIAYDEWSNENPFVGIDLDALYDILKKEKQQLIEKTHKFLIEWSCQHIAHQGGRVSQRKALANDILADFKKSMEE